ncbi:hypothetical protein [Niveibacterium sp. SC-1]|uniref:hypothetical protein n=1 Tax=Niveibacterium sp. SC-1 TaxID=3135646 RepID=UPI0031205543
MNLIRLLALGCAVLLGIPCCAATLPDGSTLTLAQSGRSVKRVLRIGHHLRHASIDSRLHGILHEALDAFVVGGRGFSFEGHVYAILAVTKQSAKDGRAYCGAGTEEVLLLVELQRERNSLALRDSLKVQSCLETFELISDRGHELRRLLAEMDEPSRIGLTWLNHPQFGDTPRVVTVSDGKFRVE